MMKVLHLKSEPIGKIIFKLWDDPTFKSTSKSRDISRDILLFYDICRRKGHRRIAGYDGLCVRRTDSTHENSKTKVFLIESAKRAVLFAQDISLWDLDNGYVIARFKPDIPVS